MNTNELKNAVTERFENLLRDHAYKSLTNSLKDDGISLDDLTDEEFEELLAEEIQKQRSFTKGVGVGTGIMVLMELLG